MRLFFIVATVFNVLAGCAEVLREPDLKVGKSETPSTEQAYEVTALRASSSVIAQANKSPFIRYAYLGSDRKVAARKLREDELFTSNLLPSSFKPVYKIGSGDSIEVTRSGYRVLENGISTRSIDRTTYVVDEVGKIKLKEGPEVFLKGLSIEEAKISISGLLELSSDQHEATSHQPNSVFPGDDPPEYQLGKGDVIQVSRLVSSLSSSGVVVETIESTQHTVGPDGVVSILQLGELFVDGLTLSEVRDRVIQAALSRDTLLDTVVEIKEFRSKSALLVTSSGILTITITDRNLSFRELLAQNSLIVTEERDYKIKLERRGKVYHTTASQILNSQASPGFVFDGDKLTLTEIGVDTGIDVTVSNFASQTITFVRVNTSEGLAAQQGQTMRLSTSGMDLRQLLVDQGVNVNRVNDLLVSVNRSGHTYRMSGKSIVLDNPHKRYWLQDGDHVVVEDLAYVGDWAILVGQVSKPSQFPVNRVARTSLSTALFDGGLFSASEADFKHVYVLRGSGQKYSAYHFDISEVVNLTLAEQLELRPSDIIFVRRRPISNYNRALALVLTFVNAIDAGITNSRTFGR